MEGKDEDTDLMENEFTVSIYKQPRFEQRSEKLILLFISAKIRVGVTARCALIQRICPEASVADSYGFIK